MPQLASRHAVVAVDLRGAGHSDKPQRGYDKASLAGDVHGAMTALALGLTHRDAVAFDGP